MAAQSKPKAGSDGAKRRVPTQARSLRRYEAILAAASEAFADHGFEATTMEGIAARAETSIGSLYQFFPNKTAVFREVAQRALALSRTTFAELMGPNPAARPWRELIEVVVDGYFALNRDATMRAIFSNVQLYQEYAADDEALIDEMVLAVAMLLGVWSPKTPKAEREVVATLVVNTTAAAMLLIARAPDDSQQLVTQTKLLLIRYLQPYVEPPG